MARVITNPSEFRSGVAKGLEGLLADSCSEPVTKLSQNVEKTVLNYAIAEAGRREVVRKWDNQQFVEIYIARLRSLWRNMANPEFAVMIVAKEVTPAELAKMTHQDMAPGRWEELIQTKRDRDENKYAARRMEIQMITNADVVLQNVTYELQTRSADEPMTVCAVSRLCKRLSANFLTVRFF